MVTHATHVTCNGKSLQSKMAVFTVLYFNMAMDNHPFIIDGRPIIPINIEEHPMIIPYSISVYLLALPMPLTNFLIARGCMLSTQLIHPSVHHSIPIYCMCTYLPIYYHLILSILSYAILPIHLSPFLL